MQVFLQTLIGGIGFGAIYALVALGFSLVYRTMGLVNFAHGDVAMLGAYIATTFYVSTKLPFAVAMASAIICTAVVGLVIERVLRPLENKDFDLMLIGTIGFGIGVAGCGDPDLGCHRPGGPEPCRHPADQRLRRLHPQVRPHHHRRCCGGDSPAVDLPRSDQAWYRHAGGSDGP